MAVTSKPHKGLTTEAFKLRLDRLVGKKPIKIWLAKSARGHIDVIFSVGDAQGVPIRNFDHIGGFYLMGENVPPEYIDRIHRWFVDFAMINHTPHRIERHFIDVNYRKYLDGDRKYREELLMHVPLTVHTPIG
jgi:hypothetical protein